MVAVGACGPVRDRPVLDVLHHRLALLVLDLIRPPLGRDVDRGSVERRRDLARQERAVVRRVVPREAALVARVLPERLHELHGLHRGRAVEHDLLARPVHLHAAEAPRERVGPRGRVAEGVAERLADRLAFLLELHPDLPQLVERLWPRGLPDLLEPGLPVGELEPDDAVRQREPPPAVLRRGLGLRVVGALLRAQPLAQVGDVDEPVRVEVGPVVEHHDDIRPRARLDRRGDSRLQVVGVDELEDDLGAQRLRGLARLTLKLHVARGDEVDPAQDVESRPLRERRRPPRGDHGLETRRRDTRGEAGGFQEVSATHVPSRARPPA